MSSSSARHLWTVATQAPATGLESTTSRESMVNARPEPDLVVLCHRRRRGPYTGGGELLRHAVPELLAADPSLVALRATEIIALAPELTPIVPVPPQTLTNLADPEERTRFYAVGRSQRLAHGVTELLLDWARLCRPDGVTIELRELDEADQTDHELLATLLRRCDPASITVIAETETTAVSDDSLQRALNSFTSGVVRRPQGEHEESDDADPAQVFIDSEGLDTDPATRAAYLELAPRERARRHTARADLLAGRGEPSLVRGALCYHREHGLDPENVGGQALSHAVDTSFELGFYEGAMEFAHRGKQLVTLAGQPKLYWGFTHKIGACLSYLGRGEEAMPYLAELRRVTTHPLIHMSCGYMTSMLYTRLLPKELHDEDRALEWINTAIAIADSLPDPKQQVFFGAFMRNARALVDLHRRDLSGALAQVNRAIEITDAAMGPDEHMLHRSVLRYNRAQVHGAIGDHAATLADFDEAIRRDPDYGDYYFDRATARRNAGLYAEALADYATAIRLTPPFYEAHYNRADLFREIGQDDDALRDLDYALELEPTHVDSLINRADILMGRGEIDLARADIEVGLRVEPDNPHLLCAQGSLLAETGDDEGAHAAYTAALAADPGLLAAWVNRAVLVYSAGRLAEAVADLDHALELTDDPALRVNRAIGLQELGEHRRAIADLDQALTAMDAAASADGDGSADGADVLYRRGVSRRALGDTPGARADWDAHLAAYAELGENSPYAEQIAQLGADPAAASRV